MSEAGLRVVIADDERPARERLKRLLAAAGGVEVVAEAADGVAAVQACAAHQPDVLFLDIDMPELNGLEVAATLGAAGPIVVFCTAYDEHAVQAFELSAADYLLKPVSEARIAACLARLRRARPTHPGPDAAHAALTQLLGQLGGPPRLTRLAVRCGARLVVCELAEVAAIVAKDHYAELLWGERRILADDGLDALALRLDPAVWLRIHRGSLVNLRFLKELRREGDRKYVAVLGDHFATELPVSREKLAALRAALGLPPGGS